MGERIYYVRIGGVQRPPCCVAGCLRPAWAFYTDVRTSLEAPTNTRGACSQHVQELHVSEEGGMPSAPTNKGCPVCGDHNPELLSLPNGSPPGYTYQVRCRRGDFTATAAGEIVTAVANWNNGVGS